MTECSEIAANMSLEGFNTLRECRALVDKLMPDETTTVRTNVADALWARYVDGWPHHLFQKRILEVTSGSKLGCILRAVFRDPRNYLPRFSYGAIITTDGYIMVGFTNSQGEHHNGAFMGSAFELTRNLIGLSVHAKLSPEEIVALGNAVDAWISTDYRSGAANPPTLILSSEDAKRAGRQALADLLERT